MRYWDDMQDKYSFGDGAAIPAEAELCRSVYVQAVNALAEHKGSKVRAVCYNRPGCHNPILILMLMLEQFETLTPAQVMGEDDLPDFPDAKEPTDDSFEAAVEECQEQGLDDYVIVEPKLSPAFAEYVAGLSKGIKNLTSDDFDAVEEALGREVDADEVRNALDEYKDYKDVKALRKLLRGKERDFKAAGGRGVELADEIDKLRMVLAVLESRTE